MATLAESFLADLEDLSDEEEEQDLQQNGEENNAEASKLKNCGKPSLSKTI